MTAFFDEIEAIELISNMMQPIDVAKTLKYVLETPDNLINEITMRPLNPKPPQSDKKINFSFLQSCY